jgi:hypothetical protein
MFKVTIGGLVAALAACGPAAAASVELRHVVAQVTVIPEDRADVAVTVVRADPRLPLRVHEGGGGVTVVDGGSRRQWWRMVMGGQVARCPGFSERASLQVMGVGAFTRDQLPQIVIRTPRQVRVQSHGAVLGSIGRSESLALSIAGCDHWTLANVRGDLDLHDAGSGGVRAGSAGRASVKIAGSGDIALGQVARGLKVGIAGSGDVRAAEASGPLEVDIAGDGDVRVGGGHASAVKVTIAGSGDVDYGGVADSLDVSIAGSGDISVAKVTGTVNKSVAGSGHVTYGR